MTPTDHSHDDHLYADDELHNEDVAHEHTDVNVRQLLMYTAGLVMTCVASAVIVWVLFGIFARQAAANDPVLSPLAIPAGQLPPEPRLVTNEPAVLRKQRAIESETLDEYGWVDRPGGVARLPIDEAKKKLLHEGLPVRAGAPADPWLGTHAPARGESSGGRESPGAGPSSQVRIQKLEGETKPPAPGTKPSEPRKPH
jgi:hypothetical protein